MASSVLQVRIDESLRNETNEIFNNLGLNMSSAIRLFLNRVVIAQGLPFPMTLENQFNNANDSFEPLIENNSTFDPIAFLESIK